MFDYFYNNQSEQYLFLQMPLVLIKSVYLKIGSEHIQHIVDQYKAPHHRITHKDAYLRKMLYTVRQELDTHVTNAV